MPGDMLSRPLSTVAPVAVMPDMLSKMASARLMRWASMNGSEAKMHTSNQLDTVSMYMSRGRSSTPFGWPWATMASPATKVIRLDQRKALSSWARSNITRVSIGTTKLTARVIRKMPLMKAMMRRVGTAI
ncbi:hypothetical protein D3C72_2058440 [compost metagenome]